MASGRTGWSRLASRAWHPQPSGFGISGQGRAAHSTAQPLHLFMHRPSRAVLQLQNAAARPSQPAPPSSTSPLQGTRRRPTQSRHTPARPDQHHHPPRRATVARAKGGERGGQARLAGWTAAAAAAHLLSSSFAAHRSCTAAQTASPQMADSLDPRRPHGLRGQGPSPYVPCASRLRQPARPAPAPWSSSNDALQCRLVRAASRAAVHLSSSRAMATWKAGAAERVRSTPPLARSPRSPSPWAKSGGGGTPAASESACQHSSVM